MPHSPKCSLVEMVEGFLVTRFSIYILHAVPFIINHSWHRSLISMVFSELIVYNFSLMMAHHRKLFCLYSC